MRTYSTKVGIDKAESLSMSLVEGLVRKLTREYNAQLRPAMRQLQTFVHGPLHRTTKAKKRVEKLLEFVKTNGWFSRHETSEYRNEDTIIIATWYEGDHKDLPGFRFIKVDITRTEIKVRLCTVILSRHAVARFIFRTKCNNWVHVFDEFSRELPQFELKWAARGDAEEICTRTRQGWMVAEHVKSQHIDVSLRDREDFPSIIKTWVDLDRLSEEQKGNIIDLRNIIDILKSKTQLSFLETFRLSTDTKNRIYRIYKEEGGLLTREAFLADEELLVNLILKMYDKGDDEYLM